MGGSKRIGVNQIRFDNLNFANKDRLFFLIDDQSSVYGNTPDYLAQLRSKGMFITIDPDSAPKILFDLGVLVIIIHDSLLVII